MSWNWEVGCEDFDERSFSGDLPNVARLLLGTPTVVGGSKFKNHSPVFIKRAHCISAFYFSSHLLE